MNYIIYNRVSQINKHRLSPINENISYQQSKKKEKNIFKIIFIGFIIFIIILCIL